MLRLQKRLLGVADLVHVLRWFIRECFMFVLREVLEVQHQFFKTGQIFAQGVFSPS